MVERRIYAHWLDPDYLGRYVVPSFQLEERVHQFGGFLKMHAIAGDCINISGVQLIESRLLLKSFADPGFQQFMARHPDFLRLVEQPNHGLGAKSDKLAQICGGLARLASYASYGRYISNTFLDADLIPTAAALLKGLRHEDDAQHLFGPNGKFTRLVSEYSRSGKPDRDLVAGLYFALKHFVMNPRADVLKWTDGPTVSNFSDELETALANVPSGKSYTRNSIEAALGLVRTPEERFRRSLILQKLSHTVELGHPDRLNYLVIAQAWNVAAGRSMKANCDSAYCFNGIPTVPVYSGLETGRAAFSAGVRKEDQFRLCIGQEDELFEKIIRYEWHPADLPWEIISKIRDECADDVAAYQRSIEGVNAPTGERCSESTEEKFAQFANAAAGIIAKDLPKLRSEGNWVIPTCTIAASVGAGVGAFVSLAFALPGAALVAATGGPAIAAGAYQLIRQALQYRDTHMISKMLEQYGQQYNLHRTGDSSSQGPGA